jgi:hypothetical protein
MKIIVFSHVTQCSLVEVYDHSGERIVTIFRLLSRPEDEGSTFFRNITTHMPDYTRQTSGDSAVFGENIFEKNTTSRIFGRRVNKETGGWHGLSM